MVNTHSNSNQHEGQGRLGGWIIFFFVATLPFGGWASLKLLRADFAAYVLNASHWLPPDTPELKELDRFSRFGSRQNRRTFRISWPGCQVSDPRAQLLSKRLTEFKLTDGTPANSDFEKVLTYQQLVRQIRDADGSVTEDDAHRQLENIVISTDGETACLVVTLTPEAARRPTPALQRIDREAATIPGLENEQLKMFGPPIYVSTVNSISKQLTLLYAPILIIVCLIASWFCLRDRRLIFALFFNAILSTSSGMILMFLIGAPMDPMLILLPALWFVLSLSAGIHFINYFLSALATENYHFAIKQAFRSAARPCTLATITTCVGLGSLCTSSILPVWRFGFYGAIGLLAGLFVLFTFFPALLKILFRDQEKRVPERHSPGDRPWRKLGEHILRRRVAWTIVLCAFTIICATGLPRVQISNQLSDQFPDSTRIGRDSIWFEDQIGPSIPIELMVRFSEDDPIRLFDRIRMIESIEQSVNQINGRCRVLSATTLVPGIPGGRGMRQTVRRSVVEARFRSKQTMLANAGFVFNDGSEEIWRVLVLVNNSDQISISRYLKMIREKVNQTLATLHSQDGSTFSDNRIAVSFTGAGTMMATINDRLTGALGKSYVTSVFVIACVVVVALRSLVLGLAAMIPNLFPTIVTMGLAGWYLPRMDIGSIMTASIAIGISVDDTIHFMICFHDGHRDRGSVFEAVQRAYRNCGAAIVHTSLICGLGMFVFSFCDFLPVARFGGLMFAMLAVALVGDLLFLPALLLCLPARLISRGSH